MTLVELDEAASGSLRCTAPLPCLCIRRHRNPLRRVFCTRAFVDDGPVPPADESPLSFTFQLPGGEPETHEVTGPPGVIRFAVGTHTRRSSIWRVWTNRNTSDVYVGVRNVTGVQKYSFHESGRWHFAYSNNEAASRWAGSSNRFIEKWDRPDNAVVGWTRALAVKVPHGALSELPDEPEDDKVVWLPEPPDGRIAVVGIGVVEPNRGMANMRGIPVDAYRLANGHAVVVVYQMKEFTDEIRQWLSKKLTNMPAPYGQTAADLADMTRNLEGLRMGLFGNDETGSRVVWDLAVNGITIDETPAAPERS